MSLLDSDLSSLPENSPVPIGIHKPIKDHVAIECLILRETEKAILVTVEDTRKDEWFPLSQVSYIQNVDSGDEFPDTIHTAKWLLDKKGIGY